MTIPVYKGRKINKILFIVFLTITLILLAAAGISALLARPEIAWTICIIALITGAFSLLYGILWFIYGRKEKKTEQVLNEVFGQQYASEDTIQPDYREFLLPKDRLTETALRRFRSIVLWTGIAALGVFLLICVILYAAGSSPDPLHQLSILLFSILIMVPGILVQQGIYQKYEQSVPSRIMLFPGKLIIDNTCFYAGEIREIRISPDHAYNPNSPDVFREMQVQTDTRTAAYRIDYRNGTPANGQPFWAEYESFIAALTSWGAVNNVRVFISYMS